MKDVFYLLRLERLPWPYGLSQISGMAERILNWEGGAYKRAPEALTCRGSGDICKKKRRNKCGSIVK